MLLKRGSGVHQTCNSCLWGEGGTVLMETQKCSWLIYGEIAWKSHSLRNRMISNSSPEIAVKLDASLPCDITLILIPAADLLNISPR